MERREVASLSGAILLLILVPLFIYSQLNAQNGEPLTQADFINILIRVLGLEDQLPAAATLSDKIHLLEELGYAPLGGWKLERILTKGDTATILAQMLGIYVPIGAGSEEYVQALADQGIMTPGGAELPFSLQDLTASVNIAAAMPGARVDHDIQPYRLPVSNTQ